MAPKGLRSICKSLNIMSNGPKMYLAAGLHFNFSQIVSKKCYARTYEIQHYNYNSSMFLLTPLSFDSERQSLNKTCNLAASAVLKGT